MTPKEKEPLKTKICPACGKEKSTTSFYKTKSGLRSRCKMCQLQKVNRIKDTETKVSNKRRRVEGPALFNVSKIDWIQTYNLLKSMGYDLEKNIHLQFCEKHNFQPNNRGFENSIIYSPKDLGMI
jgi:hypothetical protein